MTQVDQPAVREALHVPSASNFFDGDNGAGMVYRSTEPDLRPFYQHVANSTALRVLVYNGDTDPAINSFVAQAQHPANRTLTMRLQNPTNRTLTVRLPPQPHRPVSTPAPASRARLRDAPIFTREHLPFLLATPSRPLLLASCLSYRSGPRTWASQPRSRGERGPSTAAAVWVAT